MNQKPLLVLSGLLIAASMCPHVASLSHAQAPQASSSRVPVETTVCDIAADPKSFAGKTVMVHATIIINHIYEGIADPANCRGKEVLLGDSDAKQKDAAMKQFDSVLHAQFIPLKKMRGVCMYDSCHQYTVSAMLVGTLDYPISELGNAHAARLELISVSQVNSAENSFDPKIFRRP